MISVRPSKLAWKVILPGCAVVGMAIAATLSSETVSARGPTTSAFLGASPGVAVPFETVPLPPVPNPFPVSYPFITAIGSRGPFDPTFEQFVTGDFVIRTEAQMRFVWQTLFNVPYKGKLFDFDSSFVVLMGDGLSDPSFGFDICHVETFDATFANVNKFDEPTIQPGLVVVGVTFLPGPPPPPADPIYHVAAVKISNQFFSDILFHRETFFAP